MWIDPRRNLAGFVAFPLTAPGNRVLIQGFGGIVYRAVGESEGEGEP